MNYTKLDAALAGELEHAPASASLAVFIEAGEGVTKEQLAELAVHGINPKGPSQKIVTATLSPKALDTISQFPWIRRITLARKLRPLGEP